jgi:arylsulfatase A-like enzyme
VGGLTPANVESSEPGIGLDPKAPNLANILRAGGYATAAFGKWHLAGCEATDPDSGVCLPRGRAFDPLHPVLSGFDYYAGSLVNIGANNSHYCRWLKTVSRRTGPGASDTTTSTSQSTVYATVETVNDALAQIANMPEPWFAWVAFNAPHKPLHVVPNEPVGCTSLQSDDPVAMYDQMTEKLDSEIGRLLSSIGHEPGLLDRTNVIFLSDNGTFQDGRSQLESAKRGKGTLMESGIRVPLIIVGPRIDDGARGTTSAALVNTTDVFSTVLELAGIADCPRGSTCGVDSISLVPYFSDPAQPTIRQFAYSELFASTRGHVTKSKQAIRDTRFKALRRFGQPGPHLKLFDLKADPGEEKNLLEDKLSPRAREALAGLSAELTRLVGGCLADDDRDGDCVPDAVDNCRKVPNGPAETSVPGVGNQLDSNEDGLGDACQTRKRERRSQGLRGRLP